jgi:penicillin-binding protein 2
MNDSPSLHNTVKTWRILIFIVIVAVVFVLYIVRLFSLQILQGPEWAAAAEENRIREINLPTQRGIITDRNGIILARNIPSYDVTLTYAKLPDDPGAVQEIYRQLSELTKVPLNRGVADPDIDPYVPCRSDHGIIQIATYGENSKPFEPVKVACNIDRNLAMIIKEKAVDWPGIDIEVESVRDYPTGELTADIVGFLGPISETEEQYYTDRGFVANRDKVGYAGVERYFQSFLSGRNGDRLVEVDVGGRVIKDVAPIQEPVPGFNLNLTIDTRLQSAAEAILIKEINFWNQYLGRIQSTSGVVIAMNPKTGEVLAMVSYPSYENNRMARQIPEYYYKQLTEDPRNPLLNHAVGDELPAGSVFKLVTGVGALNEGVVTPDQMIKAPPEITISNIYFANDPGRAQKLVDWNKNGFGELDFVHCVANSSNVCFYKLGGGYGDEVPEGLGICRLGTYARAMGYGAYPGIELPLVEDGLIPDPTWKRINHGENWSTGDTYIASVGQGYVVATPLQVLLSATVVANNGVLVRPTILREITDSDGNVIKSFLPDQLWDITKDPVIDVISDPDGPGGCEAKITGKKKTVQPWVIQKLQEGMRLVVLEGTLKNEFKNVNIAAAGKTGTAEYCDKYADAKNLCIPGSWPTHAWTVAYAPYDEPEIAVVAFVYNGGEGAVVAGPIVRQVLQAYFEIKATDTASGNP